MRYKIFGIVAVVFLLMAISLYGQDVIVTLLPYDGTAATYVNAQIVADTVASGGLLATHVYELQRGQFYLHNAVFIVPNGKTLRLRGAAGEGKKPVIYLWETGTGSNPTRPPGYFVQLNGGNIEVKDICIAGFYEYEPDRVSGVQGALIRNTAPGSSIVLEDVIFSNTSGNHVRTEQNVTKVKVTNSIFANMGALTTSNLGAGKGLDLRDVRVDSLILVNNTFVNYQDRAVRHYTTDATKGVIDYALIDHNTFVNGMGYHGLLSLGNVGSNIMITNNMFYDAFALGEDSTDATRAAEWANTGEFYPNGRNRITWIFSTPNTTTQWTVRNNYYAISDSGWAFLNAFNFPPGSPLSYHINSKLGADSANAFTQVDLTLGTIPRLMTNMMRWYEDPAGGNKSKNTPGAVFDVTTDDYDRRVIEFYRDTLDCAYPTASVAYTGAEDGYPVGDLNWFPNEKALWEQGFTPLGITVDGNKDAFYEALTGPDDGYLQLKYYSANDNGTGPYNNADLSAKMWAAWDEVWFYFYEEVMDDTISMSSTNTYNNDGFEMKIDPQPTDSATNSITSLDITALYTEGVTGQTNLGSMASDLKQYARKVIPGGYALEFAVKWSAITAGTPAETITPAVGNVFGAALHNHDNDNKTGTREASVAWAAVLLDAVWNTPKYLGTVKFLADNKLQFIPTNNMTPRTNPVPYDGTPFFLTIDGKKDAVYRALKGPNDGYLQMRSYAYNDNGKPKNDADLSAKVWTAWDDKWFYVYEEVKDDTLSAAGITQTWESYLTDNLELKIDPQPTDSVTNSVWETRLTALAKTTGIIAADSLSNVADSLKQWKRTKVTGGYNLELAIKWSAIKSSNGETITPAVDNVFGMAICQHDNDGKGRQASVNWGAALLDAVWNTPKYHGTVKFLADNKMQFIPKNNVTGLNNPVPYDGSNYTRTGVVEDPVVELPKVFSLEQNYPNPFNPTTNIDFSLDQDGLATLTIYNMVGQKVATLVDAKLAAGYHTVHFDASHLANGIYFYKLTSSGKVSVKKMLLLK